MPEFIQYSFMQKALLAGAVIAIISPSIGIYLVLRRLSMIGDTLAHISMAGVAAGLITGINAILSALVFSAAAALGIENLRKAYSKYAELAIAIMMSTGIGLALLLINLGKGDTANLLDYLFGSIISVSSTDLAVITGVGAFVLISLALLRRELFYITFDEEAAKLSGIPVSKINIFFILLTAMTIAVSMRIVGILLVSSLMILPVALSLQLAKSFKNALLISVASAMVSVVTGLILSFYLDMAPGGTIVLVSVLMLVIVLIFKNITVKNVEHKNC